MPQYRYRAVDQQGRQIRGSMAAANEQDLLQRLSEIHLDLIDFRDSTHIGSVRHRRRRVPARDVVQICIHLSALLKAGVPLLDCLEDVRDSADHPALKEVLTELYRDVAEGVLFSEALQKHPRIFSNVFVAVIQAGEETGDLAGSFTHLVAHLRWTDDMQHRLIRATRYPAFLFLVIFTMFFVLMKFTMPGIVRFLQFAEVELPWYTQLLVAVSRFIDESWYLVLGLPVLLIAGAVILHRLSEDFALMLDQLVLAIPRLNIMVRKSALAQFCNMFALLYASNVPILQCLETSSKLIHNRVIARSISTIRQQVQSGSALSEAVENTGAFPQMVVRMVHVGENAGTLDQSLLVVADFYTQDVRETAEDFVTVMQMTLVLIAAGLLLWIAGGTLLPIYSARTLTAG